MCTYIIFYVLNTLLNSHIMTNICFTYIFKAKVSLLLLFFYLALTILGAVCLYWSRGEGDKWWEEQLWRVGRVAEERLGYDIHETRATPNNLLSSTRGRGFDL